MKSLSKQLREWVNTNDWYSGGVLTNELKLNQRFAQQIQTIMFELDYHGQNIIARKIQERMDCLLDRCRKIDEACRAGCRTQEQFLELDFIRSRAIGLANELAELLEMVKTIQNRPATDIKEKDEWISLSDAANILGLTPGTECMRSKANLLRSLSQTG